MAAGMDDSDLLLDRFSDDSGEVVLPTFVVLARFRSGPDVDQALTQVRGTLEPVAGLYDNLVVERTEDDATVLVLARFVTVALEAAEAVNAVHATLQRNHITVDEAWVDRQL